MTTALRVRTCRSRSIGGQHLSEEVSRVELVERLLKAEADGALYRRVCRELANEAGLNGSYIIALHARIKQLEANLETLAKKRGGK